MISAKLLVTTGYNGDYVKQSEVIDLGDHTKNCKPWADLSTGIWTSAGVLVNRSLFLCGGLTEDEEYTKKCFIVTPSNMTVASTSLEVESMYHAAVEFDGGVLFAGGWSKVAKTFLCKEITFPFLDKEDKELSITEFFNSTTRKYLGPELPNPTKQHCMVAISDNEILLIGGKQSNR